jgi:hypothetical protein
MHRSTAASGDVKYDGVHWWTASLGDRIPFPLEAADFKLTRIAPSRAREHVIDGAPP